MMTHSDYMKICDIIASKSYAEREKVGAVLVKSGNIIAFGYNGSPSGFDNKCETEDGKTKPEVLHAESNAILKCAKSSVSSENAILYTTVSPCFECAKLIIQAGIIHVYFKKYYRTTDGIMLLEKAKIPCNIIMNEKLYNSTTGI